MDTNRIIEILEDVTMIDHRGAINAADEIMDQLMAEQRAAVDELTAARAEVERLREATIEFVNTMSDVAPVWTGKMSEALNRLSPLLISDARRYNGLSSY